MSEIKNIRDQFISKLENDLSIDQINEIKTELFGKNGLISSKFKTIGSIPEDLVLRKALMLKMNITTLLL